ncbi:MAG: roadblock/LC7 domain-containing protein [Candidatus Sericytochromatia bacterium]|nr:roadblock/LC7 domain-containing protein [Candidatus Sericytochromatia bacterium]
MLNPQLSSLVITEQGMQNVQAILERLRHETKAKYLLLVEKSGQTIATAGEANPYSMALSALVAGAFSSTREIARLLGEQEFKTMFQQGQKFNLFIALLDTHDMLTVVFDENTTLGMIKLKSQQLGAELSREIQAMYQAKPTPLANGAPDAAATRVGE